VDFAHRADSEGSEDLVVRKGGSRAQRHPVEDTWCALREIPWSPTSASHVPQRTSDGSSAFDPSTFSWGLSRLDKNEQDGDDHSKVASSATVAPIERQRPRLERRSRW
jgi:hypothetical protein